MSGFCMKCNTGMRYAKKYATVYNPGISLLQWSKDLLEGLK